MPLELFISRRAAREIERADEWWLANRPSAPGALTDDLHVALSLLLVRPNVGAGVDQASSAGVRRFHLNRIHYWVYYRVRGNRLEVLSVWHSSRSGGPKV